MQLSSDRPGQGLNKRQRGLATRTLVRVYRHLVEDSWPPTPARCQPPLRVAEFDALFAESVRGVERGGESVRLHLAGAAGLGDTVRDLAQRETACCSFFTFAIAGSDDELTFDISVPVEYRDILSALADRANELSR
jgi:hypothetical protein